MFCKRWLPIPEIGLFHDSHVQDQGYRSPTPDHPLAPSNAYMLVCLCVSVLCPFLLLVQKMTPLSAQLLRPWRCGTWLARGTHPPCHGAPPGENHLDLPGKQVYLVFFSPFEELLIWVRAPWADNWLRLWRQPWQRQRCRGQEHTGSNAFPSPARRVLKTISDVTLVLPPTVPSFFPSALSNSTPAHIPITNGGFEKNALK